MFKRMTDSIRVFITDVRAELKKVSFPTRAETIGSTTVVIVFCVIMSLYLSVIDSSCMAGGQDHLMTVRKTVAQSSVAKGGA